MARKSKEARRLSARISSGNSIGCLNNHFFRLSFFYYYCLVGCCAFVSAFSNGTCDWSAGLNASTPYLAARSQKPR